MIYRRIFLLDNWSHWSVIMSIKISSSPSRYQRRGKTFNGRKNREKNLEDTIRNMNGTREIDVHYKFISWRCRNAKLKMKRKLKRWNMGLCLRLGFHIYGPRHNLVLNLLLLYWTTSEVEFAIEIVKSLHNAYIEKATLFDQHESGWIKS